MHQALSLTFIISKLYGEKCQHAPPPPITAIKGHLELFLTYIIYAGPGRVWWIFQCEARILCNYSVLQPTFLYFQYH